jgi:spermidine/putrescine transport system ATP-binding protein
MARDALLALDKISKRFPGGVIGLDGIDLEVAAGEFLSLLGPSGCGKTTTLRVIAGFESPTGGRVHLDGHDITALRPFDRPVNTVFQDYALFPYLDVQENVGFGLSVRKIAAGERKRRVAAALDLVGLADKIAVRVSALSGGQRQRVALARAFVCEPRILLLDEPLSALDAHLREQMQVELKRLQARLGMTFIMVTHDQTEALSISDRIAVMNAGRIEQIAPPATLYDRPATRFVARFIGTMNLFEARYVARDHRFVADGLLLPFTCEPGSSPAEGELRTIGVRPEDLIATAEAGPEATPARITSIVFHGRTLRLRAELQSGTPVFVDCPRLSANAGFAVGELARVELGPGASCSVLVG